MNPKPQPAPREGPAAEQRKRAETRRKVEMIVEWLELQAQLRERAGVYGRMVVELIWEAGCVRRAKLVDEVTIEDATPRELELLMRDAADGTGEGAAKPP